MIELIDGQTFNVPALARLVARDEVDLDDWTLYAERDTDTICPETECHVGACPRVTDSDEEVYPAFVVAGRLELLYSGQQFVDVVRNARRQLGEFSGDDIARALNHYAEHDDFLDF